MNKDNLTYNDVHGAWNQRVRRELGAKQLYTAKGYLNKGSRPKSSKPGWNRPSLKVGNHDKIDLAGRTWMRYYEPDSQLPSSYPIPFSRLNNE